jgi:preprotein translocase subunit SecF
LPQSDVGAKVDTEDEEEPITAKLADTIDESPVRVGSPFATDPFETHATPIEQIYDVGPLRYTAMGAVAAAAVVLFFAFVGFWWFPAGGAMIAALGCMLSIFGLYSTFRYTAAGLLTVHLALFVMSYGRSLG